MGAKEELTIVIILGIMYLLTIITNKDQLRFIGIWVYIIQFRRSLFEFLFSSFKYFVNLFCRKKKSSPEMMILGLC